MSVSEGPKKPVSGFKTVGTTPMYTIGSFSDGIAYLICEQQTGREKLLIGEAAYLLHDELRFMHKAKAIPGSPIATRLWSENLDDLVHRFWPSAPICRDDQATVAVPDKN